jgi:O-antigen chain-terminating methyltransferase
MTDLQAIQRRMGFAGNDEAVRRYQRHYVDAFAPGARVLDIGCGGGVFLEALRASGRHGVGVDGSDEELAGARSRGLDVVCADALDYLDAGPAGSFGGVFCAHLIEHLPPEGATRLIEGIHRVLAPGGRVVLITPDVRDLEVWTERFWLDLTHARPYPERLLVGLLAALGFRVIRSGNDPRSGRGSGPRTWLPGLWRALRLGELRWRGDVFVIAEKPNTPR